jgi:hypothetical protein
MVHRHTTGAQSIYLACKSNTEMHDWLELHTTHTMPLPASTHSHTTTRATPQRPVRHERSTCTQFMPTMTNYSTPNMKSPNKVAACRHTAGLPGPHPIPHPTIQAHTTRITQYTIVIPTQYQPAPALPSRLLTMLPLLMPSLPLLPVQVVVLVPVQRVPARHEGGR